MAATKIVLFNKTPGLNNVQDPHHLGLNPETGEVELAEALNVDIDNRYKVTRRSGITNQNSDNIHSIFASGTDAFFIQGTDLYRLNSDYSKTGLRNSLTADAPMQFLPVDDKIYYTNGYENGYILSGGVSFSWDASPYVGPATMKVFSSPPVGELLAYYKGRIFIAVGSIIYYTEPFAFSWVDLASNFIPLPGNVKMLAAVSDGLFVSTENRVFSLLGRTPEDFVLDEVADYPAIPGTIQVLSELITLRDEVRGKTALWWTEKGLCAGSSNGFFRNLTEDSLHPGIGTKGSSAVHDGKYIAVME